MMKIVVFRKSLKHSQGFSLTDVFSCLRQFLATECSLKIMKNAFYFTLKALFVLKLFKFLSRLFGRVGKRFD